VEGWRLGSLGLLVRRLARLDGLAGLDYEGRDTGRTGARATMARMVQCVKLGREAEGLEKPPIKGELGQKVFDSVSKEAWRMWLEHSKMMINEFRLDLMSESGQRIWMQELEKYFFGEGATLPPDYVPPKAK
jgi:Fe-S cluster biosynthesis and repair protein YggX